MVYAELQGAHHAFDVFNSIRTMKTIAGVDLFLAWLVDASTRRELLDRADAAPAIHAAAASTANDPTIHGAYGAMTKPASAISTPS